MSNILYRKPTNFAMVSYQALQDTRLSWKARGIYAFLVSKASIEGWKFNRDALIEASDNDGKASYDSGIKELKDLGYLSIEPIKLERGAFAGWKWTLNDQSPELPKTGNTEKQENKRSYIESSYIEENNTPYNPPRGIGNQEGNELSGINNGDLIPFPSERKNGEAKSNAPEIPDNPTSSPKDASLARDCRRIIEHLNTISGKRFSFKSKATQRLVKARLAEDHTVEDFFAAHENKRDWLNDPKWDKYYRPETLYAASHFESYLNEKPAVDPEAWRYGI